MGDKVNTNHQCPFCHSTDLHLNIWQLDWSKDRRYAGQYQCCSCWARSPVIYGNSIAKVEALSSLTFAVDWQNEREEAYVSTDS